MVICRINCPVNHRERVIDITGPHARSRNGYIYILTLIDYFSKWAEAYPMRKQEATTVANILVNRVLCHFGAPGQIVTDQSANFQSALFKDLCARLGTDQVSTTAYKPATNGFVERFHRMLNSMLGKAVSQNQRDWDEHLPAVMAAYRATVQVSTGYTPNHLFLGRENLPQLTSSLVLHRLECLQWTSNEYVDDIQRRLREAYSQARNHLGQAAKRKKHRYGLRVNPCQFKQGDYVWY